MLRIRDYLLALRTSKVSFGKEFILVLVSVIDLIEIRKEIKQLREGGKLSEQLTLV